MLFFFCNHIIWSFIRKYRKHNTLSPFILSVVHFKWWKDVTLWYSISRQHKMLLKHLYDIVTSHKRYDEALFRISNQSIFHYLDFQYFLFASDFKIYIIKPEVRQIDDDDIQIICRLSICNLSYEVSLAAELPVLLQVKYDASAIVSFTN